MDRPWERWGETNSPQVALSRFLGLTDEQRTVMAAEAGMSLPQFATHVRNILTEE